LARIADLPIGRLEREWDLALLASLRTFIKEKNIASIPGKEEALVAEAPPYNRTNFAYIVIARPYEKEPTDLMVKRVR
jgi:hypothetical protein